MKINEQLKDFFKTGYLKNIKYGSTRNELIKILGYTDWIYFSSDKDKYPSIYKYGRLEFYYEDKSNAAGLSGIMFQPIPTPAYKGLLKCNYHRWTKNTNVKEAINFLKNNNIKFEEKPYQDKEARLLLTESKVHIFFDCQETPGHYMLHKAGKFVDNG